MQSINPRLAASLPAIGNALDLSSAPLRDSVTRVTSWLQLRLHNLFIDKLHDGSLGVQVMKDFLRTVVFSLVVALAASNVSSIPSTFAMSAKDANAIEADINGQLNICNPSTSCINAKLQANATGPGTDDLSGTLLIYVTSPSSPQSCVGDMAGSIVLQVDESATATLTGTLKPTNPTSTSCVGNLQGLPVTLYVDSVAGFMRLSTTSSNGITEPVAVGTGALIVTQNT